MDISYFIRQFTQYFTIIFILAITGCGGSGGGGDDDTTPNLFTFNDITNAALSTVFEVSMTVQGIDAATAISITGGEYSLDGGTSFTSTAGTVTNGATVTVRQTSSTEFSTATTATLTVGGVSDDFVVTTLAQDIEPDSFTFVDQTDVNVSTSITGAAVTISGINDAAPISIVGGEYSLDSGTTFTSAAGTVTNNQAVTVRQTSSNLPSTETIATLTVGSVSDDFNVTTLADTTAPTASIVFPPQISFTEGATVTVRGRASDDLSAITGVEVNGMAATSSDNFATWTVEDVALTTGDNTLTVTVTDGASNSDSNAASAVIRRGFAGESFPDNSVPFGSLFAAEFDGPNNRILVTHTSSNSIIAVDLSTGVRSIFSSDSVPDANNPVTLPQGIALDTDNSRFLVSSASNNTLLAIDVISGTRTVLSDSVTPNSDNLFGEMFGVVLDAQRNRALVLDDGPSIIAVDLVSGAREILSDNNTPNTDDPFLSIAFGHLNNNRFFVSDFDLGVFEVDLTTGARTVISDATTPDTNNSINHPTGILYDDTRERLIVGGEDQDAVFSVNLNPSGTIGARTIFSDSSTPNALNPIDGPQEILSGSDDDIAYVVNTGNDSIIALDLQNGQRVIISKSN